MSLNNFFILVICSFINYLDSFLIQFVYKSYKLSGFSINPDTADAATTPAFAR